MKYRTSNLTEIFRNLMIEGPCWLLRDWLLSRPAQMLNFLVARSLKRKGDSTILMYHSAYSVATVPVLALTNMPQNVCNNFRVKTAGKNALPVPPTLNPDPQLTEQVIAALCGTRGLQTGDVTGGEGGKGGGLGPEGREQAAPYPNPFPRPWNKGFLGLTPAIWLAQIRVVYWAG